MYTVCENSTPEKQIISINTINQLHTKDEIKETGIDESRPVLLTTTLPKDGSIRDEKSWTKHCLEDLKEKDINIKYLTTDSDSRAADASTEMFDAGKLKERAFHLKDTRHLGAGQRRLVKNKQFSKHMFPGRTKAIRTKLQARFADDVLSRCAAEYAAAFELHRGKEADAIKHLNSVDEMVVSCLQGNHTHCRKQSLVCQGVESERRVWRYSYLPPSTRLNCTTGDVEMLRECVRYRLSKKTLEQTKFNTNTQKVEAVNRAYSLRNPKNITSSRNFHGRIHSTALEVNRGTGEAIVMQAEAVGAPIVPGSPVAHQLYTIQKSGSDLKQYKRTEQHKRRRCERRFARYRLYDAKKHSVDYESGLLDSESVRSKPKNISNAPSCYDHSYCKL